MPASSSKSQIRVAFSVALVVLGSIAIFVGWSIPSRFKSMPLSVLAEAGARSETLTDRAILALEDENYGLAAMFLEACKYLGVAGGEFAQSELSSVESITSLLTY